MTEQLTCKTQKAYLTEEQAADYLQRSIHSLRGDRYNNRGPAFYRINGRSIRYRICDLVEYMDLQRVEPSKS